MTGRAKSLYTYPVKSLWPEALDKVSLEPGKPFPFDRAFAFKKPGWDFDPENPEHRKTTFYHVLKRDERLGTLKTRFDLEAGTLSLETPAGAKIVEAPLPAEGRAKISAFMTEFLGEEVTMVTAPGFSFSDVPDDVVSFASLASIEALGEKIGASLHPVRFRANVYLEDVSAWSEFDLVGKTFEIGAVTFEGLRRIKRCAAVDVNPENARRDQNLVKTLMDNFGHADLGIYAKVISKGDISPGDHLAGL